MDAGSGANEGAARLRHADQQATLQTMRALVARAGALVDGPMTEAVDPDAAFAASPLAAVNRDALAASSTRDPQDREQRDLALRATFDQMERTLIEVERGTRIPLTVIRGRAQLLRRQALASGAPDQRVLRALTEIDLAVDQIVLRLAAPTAPPPPARLPNHPHEST